MSTISRILGVAIAVAALLPAPLAAQTFAAAGTRAAGMGGAFVGVADDASAIYWNPAGLAVGSYFSLVVDGGAGSSRPTGSQAGQKTSSSLIGLAMPALGLGYYRLRATTVVPPPVLVPAGAVLSSRNLSSVAEVRLDTLVTHHAAISLVQTIVPGVTVGSSLKLVRGIASSTSVQAADADEALRTDAADLLGKATNRLDLDIGVMAAGGPMKVGVTVRNVREPKFETVDEGAELALERQARAGGSYAVTANWLAAADVDLLRTRDAFGERRDVAVGVEGRLGSRLLVRTGASVNTLDGGDGSARPAYSLGASFAPRAAIYIDGHFTAGSDRAGHRWGLAARFVY